MGWANWYWKNENITNIQVYIHFNYHQNSSNTLYRNRKRSSKIHMDSQRPQIAKTILSKTSIAEEFQFLIQIVYRAVLLRSAWYRHKSRDQQNKRPRNKVLQLQPYESWQECQKTCQRKDSLFKQGFWESSIAICQQMKLDSSLLPCTKSAQNGLHFNIYFLEVYTKFQLFQNLSTK